jgi:hypothetical protein
MLLFRNYNCVRCTFELNLLTDALYEFGLGFCIIIF